MQPLIACAICLAVQIFITSCTSNNDVNNRGIALLMGNYSYPPKSGFKPLDTPENDAHAMEKALKELRFAVIPPRYNLTRMEMEEAVEMLVNKLKQSRPQVGMVYYSGHGISLNGITYLIPLDGEVSDPKTLFALPWLTERLSLGIPVHSPTQGGIIILDACRDEKNGVKGLGGEPLEQQGILIAYAAKPGTQASWVSGRGLSAYTDALVQALSGFNTTLEDILKEVAATLARNTAGNQLQEPVHSRSGPLDFKFDPVDTTNPPLGPA